MASESDLIDTMHSCMRKRERCMDQRFAATVESVSPDPSVDHCHNIYPMQGEGRCLYICLHVFMYVCYILTSLPERGQFNNKSVSLCFPWESSDAENNNNQADNTDSKK